MLSLKNKMLELIKKIRNQTGAGVVDVKKALEQANGDEQKAIKVLRKKGLEKAAKKKGRDANEGVVAHYVHTNGKVAALVKVLCETDFVARNEEFRAFAKDLAMQVTAMDPNCVRAEDVPIELVEEQKKIWKEELASENKPVEILEKIMIGKEQKFRAERALLSQAFVKDQERTVEEIVKENIAKIGENIVVEDFVRMEL